MEGLSRPLLGQFCWPLLYSQRKLASESTTMLSRGEGGKGRSQFVWPLLCATHPSRWAGSRIHTPVYSVPSAYFTEKETNSHTLGDLIQVTLSDSQNHTQG